MTNNLQFRPAAIADIEQITTIIAQAQRQMRLAGSEQWQDGYPSREVVERDIAVVCGYVLECDGEVAAYIAAAFDGEVAYDGIHGEWGSDEPYVVAHRLAVADRMKKQGVATLMMRHVEQLALSRGVRSFRADTNFDNHYIQKMFGNLGFVYRGEVFFRGAPRRAYDKTII